MKCELKHATALAPRSTLRRNRMRQSRFELLGVLALLFAMTASATLSRQTELMSRLMQDYDANLAPQVSGGTPCELQLVPLQFPEISTTLETVELLAWFRHSWQDKRLTWNSTEWGITSMHFKTGQIWAPDIIIYEMIEQEFFEPQLTAYPSGTIFMSVPRKVKFGCAMKIGAFPFDIQKCNFTLGSWSLNGFTMDLLPKAVAPDEIFYEFESAKPDRSAIDLRHFQTMQEWSLVGVRTLWKNEYYGCCPEPYPVIKVEFEISRSRVTYLVGMIVPLVIVTLIGFFSLLMPSPVSGARPALSITILLTTATVYFVASRATPFGNEPTVIGRLYMVAMVVSLILVLLSILTTGLNLIQPEDEEALKHFMFYFKMFDKDGAGTLSRAQAHEALEKLGLSEWEQEKVLKHFLKSKHDRVTSAQWRAIGTLSNEADSRAIFHNHTIQGIVHKSIAKNLKNSGRYVGGEETALFRPASSASQQGSDGEDVVGGLHDFVGEPESRQSHGHLHHSAFNETLTPTCSDEERESLAEVQRLDEHSPSLLNSNGIGHGRDRLMARLNSTDSERSANLKLKSGSCKHTTSAAGSGPGSGPSEYSLNGAPMVNSAGCDGLGRKTSGSASDALGVRWRALLHFKLRSTNLPAHRGYAVHLHCPDLWSGNIASRRHRSDAGGVGPVQTRNTAKGRTAAMESERRRSRKDAAKRGRSEGQTGCASSTLSLSHSLTLREVQGEPSGTQAAENATLASSQISAFDSWSRSSLDSNRIDSMGRQATANGFDRASGARGWDGEGTLLSAVAEGEEIAQRIPNGSSRHRSRPTEHVVKEAELKHPSSSLFGSTKSQRLRTSPSSLSKSSAGDFFLQRVSLRKVRSRITESLPAMMQGPSFSRRETQSWAREQESWRAKYHLESFKEVVRKLGNHIHRYRAADRDPRKVGRACAASLDALARRILPVLFLTYLALEAMGLWAGTPILKNSFTDRRLMAEFIEKRDEYGPIDVPKKYRMYPITSKTNPAAFDVSEFEAAAVLELTSR